MKQEGKVKLFLESLINTSACFQKILHLSYSFSPFPRQFRVLGFSSNPKKELQTCTSKMNKNKKHHDLEQKPKQTKTKKYKKQQNHQT